MDLSEALTNYRICAAAEGKSPKTIAWVTSGVGYFGQFLGPQRQEIAEITAGDLRHFIIFLQQCPRYAKHPFNKPQLAKLSLQSVQTYARAVRAFFSFLQREELIGANPVARVLVPKVPRRVVATFSEKEVEKLLAQPNKQTPIGFRNHTLMLTLIDTAARLSEVANLDLADVDIEGGMLRVIGKGGKERHIPFGQKVAKALLKYRLKHRPQPVGTERFFLTRDGRPLSGGRIEKMIARYGKQAGISRCYPHKFRHTSSVMYLRNGGDPSSLQKKLGHASLTMTRHYANLADADVKAQHMRFGVADRLKV